MLTLNLVGAFLGDDKNKTYPDKSYLYIKPLVSPPDGFLKTVRCVPPFGKAVEMSQEIGAVAVMCDSASVPDLGLGEKVALTAHCWPVLRPMWSARDNQVVYPFEPGFFYILDGEIKPAQAKAQPFGFTFAGTSRHRRLVDERIEVAAEMEGTPPAWLLRKISVKQGFRYTDAVERKGDVCISCPVAVGNKLRRDTRFEAKGICWPVLTPYWNKDTDSATQQVVPSLYLDAAEINVGGAPAAAKIDKAKTAAPALAE